MRTYDARYEPGTPFPNRRPTAASRTASPVAAWLALACAAALVSCDTASTTQPKPPSGGRTYALSYSVFAAQIDTILTAKGCDNLNCHGGGIRGTFELSPVTDKNVRLDFDQSSLQVDGTDPAASTLLTKPLDPAAGGTAHGGGSFFASTDDPDYQAILAWIRAGEYQ